MSRTRPFTLAVVALAAMPALLPASAAAQVEETYPELFNNFARMTAAHVGIVSWGPLKLSSPQEEAEVECVSLGFGSGWNGGSPSVGHGEVLGWSGGGDASSTGTELGARCKYNKGGNRFEAWVNDEPPLSEGTPRSADRPMERRVALRGTGRRNGGGSRGSASPPARRTTPPAVPGDPQKQKKRNRAKAKNPNARTATPHPSRPAV